METVLRNDIKSRHGARSVRAGRAARGFVRAFVLFASFAGLILSTTSAHALVCVSAATGNWAAAATWAAPCNVATGPTAADTVTILNGHTVTAAVNAAATSLTINAGGTLTSARVITVSGATNISGTINLSGARANVFTGDVTLNSGAVWNNTTTSAQTFGGNFINNATTFTATGTGAYTFSGAAKTISGATLTSVPNLAVTGTVTNTATLTVTTALSGAGGLTNSATGTLNIAGTSSITTLANAGTITKTGAGAMTTALATFTNTGTINLNGTGTMTGLTNSGIVNLTSSGTISALTNSATGTLNISASPVPTITTLTATAVGNVVNYTGAAAQTIKATTYATLNTSGAGAKTVATATIVNNTLSVTGGVLTNNSTLTVTAALTGTGTLTNAAAGRLNIGGTSTIATLTATAVGNIVTYTGAAAQTIFPTTYATLTTSGAGIKTVSGIVTVNTALTGTALTNSATGTLNIVGTSTITTLTATAVGNTVNYTGAAQTVKATAYSNLGLGGSGTKTITGVTVAKDLTLSGTATVTTVAAFTIGGNLNVGLGATFTSANFTNLVTGTTTVSGTLAHSGVAAKTYTGAVTINPGGVWTNTGNAPITFNGANGGLTNNGTFTAGTGIYTFSTATPQAIGCSTSLTIPSITVTAPTVLTNNCNLTVSTALAGTGNFTNGASGTLNYSVAAVPAITTFTVNTAGNTVNYTGAAQTVRPVAYSNLGLGGSGIKTMTGVGTVGGNLTLYGAAGTSATVATPLTVGGSLSIATGNTFANGANAISLAGNFAQNGTFTAGAGTFTLTGTTPHTISGTGVLGFNNLTVSNSGEITLARNVTVTSAILGAFTLTPVCPDFTLTSNGGLTVQHSCQSIISAINLGAASPTSATSVTWTVVFSQSVTGVDASAFSLVASGVTGAAITSVTGSGTNWTVTANTGSGSGTLGLNQTGPGLVVPTLSGTYTGPVYTITKDTCFTDNFNRADGAPAGNWVVANEGGTFGNPTIVGNRLRLTDASTGVSTMAALQQLFPAAGNKITVEFDYFAYNGNGADGIAVVLSDASVAPLPGAFGGSLGYAPKQVSAGGDTTHPGFAGGWIGLALDEYGNFSANTEGRTGGTAPGLTIDSVAIRGSGSGYTGYPYHRGTATLTPGVDLAGATPAPGHRYRIIIDHTNGTNAWTSVERDTTGLGTSYATLIPAYDAKVETGQAAVPTNWYLSFTGSTGASTNIHEVDNLSICTVQPQPVPTLHHIRILHDTAALTCAAETVTVKACADANCSTLYLGSVTVNVSSTGGTWSANPVTFTGGQTSITLAKTTAGAVTLGTTSTTPVAASATRCFSGATETCTLTYTASSACFDSVEKGGAASSNIFTKLSGTAFSLDVLATNSGVINTGYTGTIALDLVDPTAASGNCNDTNVGLTGAVNYTFTAVDAGRRTFSFNYPNVATNVKVRIRDSTVNQPACSTDNFSVRPGAVTLTTSALAVAPSPTDTTAVIRAGAVFTIGATTSTGATDGYTGTLALDAAKLSAQSPTDGVTQVVGGAVGTLTMNPAVQANAAPAQSNNATWSEVGYLYAAAGAFRDDSFTAVDSAVGDCVSSTLGDANLADTFDANNKIGCSIGNKAGVSFGRFIPDHFDTVATAPMNCVAGLCASPITTMAYSGEQFTSVVVTAKNTSGGLTSNYTGVFEKTVTLSAASANGGAAIITGGAGNPTFTPTAVSGFSSGSATASGAAAPAFTFTTPLTAPMDVYVRASDSDTPSVVSGGTGSTEGGVRVVSGRIKFVNAAGSSLSPLRMTAYFQYYDGTRWQKNVNDTVTALGLPGGVSLSSAITSVLAGASTFAGGLTFTLQTPSAAGTVNANVNPANVPAWMQNTSGTGTATFGVFTGKENGTQNFIYLRESY